MKIYDITLTISNDTQVWPGDTPVNLVRNKAIKQGDLYTLSQITTTVHLGSHLDAPMHFIKNGHGVDKIDLNKLIGPCLVIDFTDKEFIDSQALENSHIPANTARLLFRTRNSDNRLKGDISFHDDFAALSVSGAEWIVKHGIQLAGIDCLSIGTNKDIAATHEILLSNGVIPVEGLDLSGIKPGEYQLICLPLKIKDCDGAPVRAVLLKNE